MEQTYLDQMRPKATHQKALALRKQCGLDFFKKYSSQFVSSFCPACDNDGPVVLEKFRFEHKKCGKCNTTWCSQRPTEELLTEYYSNWEATKYWTQLLVETDVNRKMLQYNPRVLSLVNLLKEDSSFSPNVAVDLGAGSGAFALSLKETAFFNEVIAVDLNLECHEVCKKNGLSSLQGSIEDLEQNSVDFLTMNDMIEHLFDPKEFLKQCHAALTTGGYLSIACPNGEGFDFKIMKDQTVNLTPPEHLNYFNPFSIELLLESVGFEAVSITTPGMLDTQIVTREVQENQLDLSHDQYLEHLLFNTNEATIANFQEFLKQNCLSSHMLVFAKKS
jgi:2-polyprenyl-3-methyl-5-hydroxy-6-metoxy-1,4-benzoquinol methylase